MTTPPNKTTNLSGRIVGNYSIGERLGQGGMGVVYQALKIDGSIKIPVAIKYPTLELDEASEDRFRREMELMSCLSNPHLVAIRDVGIHDIDGVLRPYYAMDFVFSVTLKTLLRDLQRSGARLPLSASVYLLNEVLVALQYLHHAAMKDGETLEVIHRDVTPDNILIRRPTVSVVLTDFGVSSAVNERSREPSLVGKPSYTSPEGIESGEQTTAMDIWSIAAVAWEMLHGKKFLGDKLTLGDYPLFKAILDHDLPPFASYVPESLVDLLEHMLERDASERPSAPVARAQLLDIITESPELSLARGQQDLEDIIQSRYGKRSTSGKTEAFLTAITPEDIAAAARPATLLATSHVPPPSSGAAQPPSPQVATDFDDESPTRHATAESFYEAQPTIIRPRVHTGTIETTQVLPPPHIAPAPPASRNKGWTLDLDDPRSIKILNDDKAFAAFKDGAPPAKVILAADHDQTERPPSEELDAAIPRNSAHETEPNDPEDIAASTPNLLNTLDSIPEYKLWVAACVIFLLAGLAAGLLLGP
ncbi:MAG: serine/threonine protein kinase [Nannocystales bacterium]